MTRNDVEEKYGDEWRGRLVKPFVDAFSVLLSGAKPGMVEAAYGKLMMETMIGGRDLFKRVLDDAYQKETASENQRPDAQANGRPAVNGKAGPAQATGARP